MEDLQARHRSEQRGLQARIAQRKTAATKKTRKGVIDACALLERELKARQEREIAELTGSKGTELEADADETNAPNAPSPAVSKHQQSAINSTAHAPGEPEQEQEQGPKRKGNRQKARLARRAVEQEALAAEAAAEARSMPDRREAERTALLEQFERRGLEERLIRADGHCLYNAVADGVLRLGLGLTPEIAPSIIRQDKGASGDVENYRKVRNAAADWMASHPDDFAPFVEEPLDAYLAKVRDSGEWGGHAELLALARAYSVNIMVLHSTGSVTDIEGLPEDCMPANGDREIWLAYYRHGFGLGEHYNALKKA